MRRRAAALAAVVLATLLAPCPGWSQATDWKQIPKPPLRPFAPHQPQRIAFPNGMVVLLQPDNELPLVHGFARIRGGSRDEPGAKTGLVSLYGQAWRTGGTKARTGDDLDDFLEARAASVETSGGTDSTSISFDCLKGNLDEVFPVFVEILRSPSFARTSSSWPRTLLARASRVGTTTPPGLRRGRSGSSSTGPIRPMPGRPSTRPSPRSHATTSWLGTRASCSPTRSSWVSQETSIPGRWRAGCAGPSAPGPGDRRSRRRRPSSRTRSPASTSSRRTT